jgi:hypothetical protein
MRSAFLSPKEYRAFAAQCFRWGARAKREEHKNLTLQMAYHWMQTAQNWSAPFHQARAWRRRRPRKTTLGKSRRRTISRVRVDDLFLAVLRGVTQDRADIARMSWTVSVAGCQHCMAPTTCGLDFLCRISEPYAAVGRLIEMR